MERRAGSGLAEGCWPKGGSAASAAPVGSAARMERRRENHVAGYPRLTPSSGVVLQCPPYLLREHISS